MGEIRVEPIQWLRVDYYFHQQFPFPKAISTNLTAKCAGPANNSNNHDLQHAIFVSLARPQWMDID